jgi:uncharacterized protein YqhQ
MAREATVRAYGGQAILGGVMMRGATTWAAAVRKPDGSIATTGGAVPTWSRRWNRIPVARGVVALVESLRLGAKALEWSGQESELGGPGGPGPGGRVGPADPAEPRSRILDRIVTVVGVALILGVFFVLPGVAAKPLPGVHSGLTLSLAEGAIRIALLVGYIGVLGLIPDLRRVYEYHGAEHKAVTALEAGADLTPESVQRFTTRHPRCGTTFLLVVMVVAVLAHTLVGRPSLGVLLLSRVLLIPVVAGVSYELIKAAAAHVDNRWVARLLAPGLALQRLTTREPTADQVAVAIVALTLVLDADEAALPDAA